MRTATLGDNFQLPVEAIWSNLNTKTPSSDQSTPWILQGSLPPNPARKTATSPVRNISNLPHPQSLPKKTHPHLALIYFGPYGLTSHVDTSQNSRSPCHMTCGWRLAAHQGWSSTGTAAACFHGMRCIGQLTLLKKQLLCLLQQGWLLNAAMKLLTTPRSLNSNTMDQMNRMSHCNS